MSDEEPGGHVTVPSSDMPLPIPPDLQAANFCDSGGVGNETQKHRPSSRSRAHVAVSAVSDLQPSDLPLHGDTTTAEFRASKKNHPQQLGTMFTWATDTHTQIRIY